MSSSNAGVLYICNPNNPPFTITSQRKKNKRTNVQEKRVGRDRAGLQTDGSILLVDEAYLHFAEAKPCLICLPLVQGCIFFSDLFEVYVLAVCSLADLPRATDLLAKL